MPAANDDDFPSGEWVGFWLQDLGGGAPQRCRQDLFLTFSGGTMRGQGDDGVGRFTVTGRYDVASREVTWTKRYLGRHAVHYRGFREIKGIWGVWELDSERGGFHIWPRSEGEQVAAEVAQEIEAPVAGKR
jgi:hypothetical protein